MVALQCTAVSGRRFKILTFWQTVTQLICIYTMTMAHCCCCTPFMAFISGQPERAQIHRAIYVLMFTLYVRLYQCYREPQITQKVVNNVLLTYSIAKFLLQPTFTCKTDGSIFCQISKNRSTSGGDPKSQFLEVCPWTLMKVVI